MAMVEERASVAVEGSQSRTDRDWPGAKRSAVEHVTLRASPYGSASTSAGFQRLTSLHKVITPLHLGTIPTRNAGLSH